MTDFQLVRAEDTEVVVWNTEHGHVFVFRVDDARLSPGPVREAPGAEQPAAPLSDAALVFATAEARQRRLVD